MSQNNLQFLPATEQDRGRMSNICDITCTQAVVVYMNFRAGSTFPVPVCTVSPGHCVNEADTQ